jgi:hypothetical protein
VAVLIEKREHKESVSARLKKKKEYKSTTRIHPNPFTPTPKKQNCMDGFLYEADFLCGLLTSLIGPTQCCTAPPTSLIVMFHWLSHHCQGFIYLGGGIDRVLCTHRPAGD